MGYIYKITNLLNGKIYIGQTTRTVDIRWKEHIRSVDKSPIHIAIQKYGANNFKVETLEECDNEFLNQREQYYIELFNSYNGHIGYNATRGGDANCDHLVDWIHNHPQDVKKNLDKARIIALEKFKNNLELQKLREEARLKGYQEYIKNNHDEWLFNQQKKLEKAREKLKEQYKEDPFQIIKRAQENGKKASKPVNQLDKETGKILNTFASCSEAARFLNKEGGHTNISKACKKGNTAYGYRWSYN